MRPAPPCFEAPVDRAEASVPKPRPGFPSDMINQAMKAQGMDHRKFRNSAMNLRVALFLEALAGESALQGDDSFLIGL